jgi:hypothetical protein
VNQYESFKLVTKTFTTLKSESFLKIHMDGLQQIRQLNVPFAKERTVRVCHAGSDTTGFVEKAH